MSKEKIIDDVNELEDLHCELEEIIKKEAHLEADFISNQKKRTYLNCKLKWLEYEIKITQDKVNKVNLDWISKNEKLNQISLKRKQLEKKIKSWKEIEQWENEAFK